MRGLQSRAHARLAIADALGQGGVGVEPLGGLQAASHGKNGKQRAAQARRACIAGHAALAHLERHGQALLLQAPQQPRLRPLRAQPRRYFLLSHLRQKIASNTSLYKPQLGIPISCKGHSSPPLHSGKKYNRLISSTASMCVHFPPHGTGRRVKGKMTVSSPKHEHCATSDLRHSQVAGRLLHGEGAADLGSDGAQEGERLGDAAVERLGQAGAVVAVLQAVARAATGRRAALRAHLEPGLPDRQPRRLPCLRLLRHSLSQSVGCISLSHLGLITCLTLILRVSTQHLST